MHAEYIFLLDTLATRITVCFSKRLKIHFILFSITGEHLKIWMEMRLTIAKPGSLFIWTTLIMKSVSMQSKYPFPLWHLLSGIMSLHYMTDPDLSTFRKCSIWPFSCRKTNYVLFSFPPLWEDKAKRCKLSSKAYNFIK